MEKTKRKFGDFFKVISIRFKISFKIIIGKIPVTDVLKD